VVSVVCSNISTYTFSVFLNCGILNQIDSLESFWFLRDYQEYSSPIVFELSEQVKGNSLSKVTSFGRAATRSISFLTQLYVFFLLYHNTCCKLLISLWWLVYLVTLIPSKEILFPEILYFGKNFTLNLIFLWCLRTLLRT
jgi:hypothetical protein